MFLHFCSTSSLCISVWTSISKALSDIRSYPHHFLYNWEDAIWIYNVFISLNSWIIRVHLSETWSVKLKAQNIAMSIAALPSGLVQCLSLSMYYTNIAAILVLSSISKTLGRREPYVFVSEMTSGKSEWRRQSHLKLMYGRRRRSLWELSGRSMVLLSGICDCPNLLSIAVRKIMAKSHLRRRGFIWLTVLITERSQVRNSGRAGT